MLDQVFRKRLINFSFEAVNMLCGFETADTFFERLLTSLRTLLTDSRSSGPDRYVVPPGVVTHNTRRSRISKLSTCSA